MVPWCPITFLSAPKPPETHLAARGRGASAGAKSRARRGPGLGSAQRCRGACCSRQRLSLIRAGRVKPSRSGFEQALPPLPPTRSIWQAAPFVHLYCERRIRTDSPVAPRLSLTYNTQIKLLGKGRAEKKAPVVADLPSPNRPFSSGFSVYLFFLYYFTKCLTTYLKSGAAFYYYCFIQVCTSFIFRGNFISICLKSEPNKITRIMFSP